MGAARERMRRVTRIRLLLAIAAAAALAAAAISIAQTGAPPGRIGPGTKIQPSGRLLTPVGKLTALGNHPGGGALTPNGRFLWALDAGRGRNDIQIVNAAPDLVCKPVPKGKAKSKKAKARKRRAAKRRKACLKSARKKAGKVVQTIPMPGVS